MPMFGYYRQSFRDLLVALKELQADKANTQRLQSIQNRLFKRITYIEKRIRVLRRRVGEFKGTVRHGRQSHECVQALRGQIHDLRSRIAEYQWLLHAFRLIGDGLVYTYFHKWDIKPLAFREAAGFLSGKQGCRFERQFVKDVNNSGVPAIQNDLTNCLRYGDVCLFDDLPHIVEVKSGPVDDARVQRQVAAIERISNYLHSDVVNDEQGVPRLRRVALHSEEVNHIDAINQVLRESRLNQHGYVSPEEGLHYLVTKSGGEGLLSSVLTKVSRPVVFWLNDMKNRKNWASYYPYTLSFQLPEDIIDFIEGELNITVVMDEAVFARYFASRGYAVRVLGAPIPCVEISPLLMTGGKGQSFQWSMHFAWRIAFEFVSLTWMIDEMISQCESWATARNE